MGVLSTEEIKARGLDTSVILEPNQYEEVDYADNTLTIESKKETKEEED